MVFYRARRDKYYRLRDISITLYHGVDAHSGLMAISVARARLSKKARERAQRERNVCQTRISLSPPAAPNSFPDLSPGSIITRSRVLFCQLGPSRCVTSCVTRARKKKERSKRALSCRIIEEIQCVNCNHYINNQYF